MRRGLADEPAGLRRRTDLPRTATAQRNEWHAFFFLRTVEVMSFGGG